MKMLSNSLRATTFKSRVLLLGVATLASALVVPSLAAAITGVGPETLSKIPGNSTQVVLVVGELKGGEDARARSTSTASLWEKRDGQWVAVKDGIPCRNGQCGWTTPDERKRGDLTSPIGVFTLTDAGGFEPNPGTKMSYETHANSAEPDSYTYFKGRTTKVDADGNLLPVGPSGGVGGLKMDEAFDYGVVVNFNRPEGIPASSSEYVRPLGDGPGDDIWIHGAHGAPTSGCITVAKDTLREILMWLDSAAHPVIVMGDKATLLR